MPFQCLAKKGMAFLALFKHLRTLKIKDFTEIVFFTLFCNEKNVITRGVFVD